MYEGLVDEGLTIVKAVRDRYDGLRRNPWDEVECGHHYARAMSSWGGPARPLRLRVFAARRHEPGLRPEALSGRFPDVLERRDGWGGYSQKTENARARRPRSRSPQGELKLKEFRSTWPDSLSAKKLGALEGRGGREAVKAAAKLEGKIRHGEVRSAGRDQGRREANVSKPQF